MDKPKVTDEHLKKYDEIMKTPTTGATTPKDETKPEEKPKTEEKPSTPPPEPKPEEKQKETKPEPQPTTNPGASDLASKGFVFTGKKIMSLDGKDKKDATIHDAKKSSSKSLLIIVAVIFIVGWGVFWAFFFGYIKF